MRIKHLYVSEYKNLKDFSLDFDGDSFIDVFVGKNGSGKSNLFEAIIEIFRHLYETDYTVDFEYSITYDKQGANFKIEWIKEKLKVNDVVVSKVRKEFLPDNILIYYSGHNAKVTELILQCEGKFRKRLRGAEITESREFIGIGNDYKDLLLSTLLLQPYENKAKQFIVEKLGIKSISPEFKIILQRPTYARGKDGFDVDKFVTDTRYWRVQGIIQNFLDKLQDSITLDTKGIRKEGYFGESDEYIHYISIEKFQEIFVEESAQSIFRSFDNLKTLDMLVSISMGIRLTNDSKISVNQFSDGQFQSIYIYSVVELFKDKNCITLLDEPDSFLHPEWQFIFLKQIFEITDAANVNNHVLMTSHSAMTLIPYKERKINLFSSLEGKLKCHQVNKSHAVEQLSSKYINYSEQEQILSIINNIKIDTKPILFTEGSTDPAILNQAWNKLYNTPIPFNIVYAFTSNYLRMLIQDVRVINELNGKPMFALFDFDRAYNEWNYIKEDARLESNPYNGLTKKIKDKNSYAIMLPVPRIAEIEKQVIKDPASKSTFEGESEMEIEHLFYGDPTTHQYFNNEIIKGGGTIIKFKDLKKTEFAQDKVPTIDKEHFEVFRPMFEFIKSKI